MGSNQKLLAAGHAELVEDAGEVMAHGRGTDAETVGNVFIGEASPNQIDDLMLAFGQVVRAFRQ